VTPETASTSGAAYRRSTTADAGAVFDLTAAAIAPLAPDPYPEKVVYTWMTGRTPETYRMDCAAGSLWIAEIDGRPAGFCHAVPGEVVRLFVAPQFGGKGVGRTLMTLALADARAGWNGPIRIDATLNAVSFYRQWGFVERADGTFPGRSRDLPEIAVKIMELTETPEQDIRNEVDERS